MPSPTAATELHPAAQVQKWKLNLRGWLWNPDTKPGEAERIGRALLQSGHIETRAEYSDILAALGARQCWQASLDIWNRLVNGPKKIRPDLKAFNTALRVLGNGGQWEHALAVLHSAPSLGVQPDVESVHHATAALGEGNQWETALSMLSWAGDNSMKPDVECYSAAIKALCNSGQHADGLWMLHEVEGMQLRPDERVYEAIILSCSELGEWERALVFLDYMAQIGFSPNAFCFINAMQACANCGQWEQVLHLFDEMQESAIRRPVRAFSLSLDVCQASGKWERALLIFDEFISKGGILEEDLVEPLVKACLAAKQGPRVRQLLMQWDKLGFLPSYALSRFVADNS